MLIWTGSIQRGSAVKLVDEVQEAQTLSKGLLGYLKKEKEKEIVFNIFRRK
jgi:hypothetical protein